MASKVLFALSLNNFNAVFSRISYRLTELSNSGDESGDCVDIELIQHINVDIGRLIKLFNEVNVKFKALNVKKGVHNVLLLSLEKAVWNWMDFYPTEFVELQKRPNQELEDACDKMFDLLDVFADGSNKRRQVIIIYF